MKYARELALAQHEFAKGTRLLAKAEKIEVKTKCWRKDLWDCKGRDTALSEIAHWRMRLPLLQARIELLTAIVPLEAAQLDYQTFRRSAALSHRNTASKLALAAKFAGQVEKYHHRGLDVPQSLSTSLEMAEQRAVPVRKGLAAADAKAADLLAELRAKYAAFLKSDIYKTRRTDPTVQEVLYASAEVFEEIETATVPAAAATTSAVASPA